MDQSSPRILTRALRLFFNNGKTGNISNTNATSRQLVAMGLFRKIAKLPSDMNKDCRRDLSNIGPRTKAIARGAVSYLYFLRR
jgi:hypothetical protein